MSEVMKGKNNPMYGKQQSEESKRKNSEAHKDKPLSEEARHKVSEAVKDRIWIHNGINSKRVYDEQLQQYLDKGYKLGRSYFKRRHK